MLLAEFDAEAYERDIREEGRAEGREQGRMEAQEANVRRMFKEGKPLLDIAESLDLPLEMVRGIAADMETGNLAKV